MRVHSQETIQRLRQLRKRGHSINELVNLLSVPKTTVWHHVHTIPVSSRYVATWKAKRGGSAQRTIRNWEKAREQARKLLNSSRRDLAIAVAMLYWGEGSKRVCEFINSDGEMIKLYVQILRTIFKVPEKLIKPTLRIFDGMDRNKCLAYWVKATGVPKAKFLVRLNDGGTRGRTKYGMCRITILKGSLCLKLIHSLKNEFVQSV